MKKYFIFAYESYYPYGGMEDFLSSFETREEAEEFVRKHKDGQYGESPFSHYDIANIEEYL